MQTTSALALTSINPPKPGGVFPTWVTIIHGILTSFAAPFPPASTCSRLESNYRFHCSCERCQEEEESEAAVTAVGTPEEEHAGAAAPVPDVLS